MKVAVIGGGPAGSYCAYRLATDGHDVVLIDPTGPHEKTCGGGVPFRCLERFPRVYEDFEPAKRIVDTIEFSFTGVSCCTVVMPGGLCIFSRRDHDAHLFAMAEKAGAAWKKQRFKHCQRPSGRADGWTIGTDAEEFDADFIVGADGAASRVRNFFNGRLDRRAYYKAIDFLVDRDDLPAHIGLHSALNGYLWVFPRADHASVGIADYGDDGARRNGILNGFLDYAGVSENDIVKRRTAAIPALRASDWRRFRASGPGWALIGDAGGFTDALTGEGIHYALVSADCFADCLRDGLDFNRVWRKRFGRNILQASRRRGLCFKALRSPLAFHGLKRSETIRQILGETMADEKTYSAVKWDVLKGAPRIAWQLATG